MCVQLVNNENIKICLLHTNQKRKKEQNLTDS